MAKKKHKKQTPIVTKPIEPGKITPYPEAGPKVVEFEKTLDGILNQPETSHRGPGRPRKEERQPDAGPQLTATAIRAAVEMPFNLWSQINELEELQLSKNESAELATAIQALLDYYMPELPPVVLLWCNFSLTAYLIMQPRLSKIKEVKKQKLSPLLKDDGSATRMSPGQSSDKGRKTTFPSAQELQKI